MLDVVVTLDGWAAATGPSVEGLDPTGCLWWLDGFEGWNGSGTVRSGLTNRVGQDGVRGRSPLRNGRVISIAGSVVAPDDVALAEAEERFSRILMNGSRRSDLIIDERYRGVAKQAQVELNGESLFVRRGTQEATWSLSLIAPDPVRYSTTLSTQTTSRYVPGGGVTFPITHPITFAPSITSGVVGCNNLGNTETWPRLSLSGPLTNPTVRLRGGAQLGFVIDLLAGQVIDVDTRTRDVYLGTASQRSKLTIDSKFFSLPVGGSELILDAESGGGNLTVQYRSAWI